MAGAVVGEARTVLGYRMVPVTARLRRVVDARGRVIGHVAETELDGCSRVVARRFHAGAGAFVEVGSFWDVADAVRALHHSR